MPIGVTVFDENNKKIGELNEPGETCIAAKGGIGGCSGNNFIGTRGEERVVTLDLKLIADVGMVKPNLFLGPFTYLVEIIIIIIIFLYRLDFPMLARVLRSKQYQEQHRK